MDNKPKEPKDSSLKEIGYSSSVNDYLVLVDGLPNVAINELVVTENGTKGLVISFKNNSVEVLMLDDSPIKPKEVFKRTFNQLNLNIGSHLVGRTIDPLGRAIDGKGPISAIGQNFPIEQSPATLKSRETITKQFETGLTLVDMLVPIAYGQRELVIGDSHSGKTGFIIDTIINQRNKEITCVLALIGKPINEIRKLVDILKSNKALEYTIVIASSSSDKATLGFLNPSVALTIAEYFQKRSRDVLLILDDMGTHAKIYREISLLSGRPPGRQSYPGDVFYQHAKLMERAGNFSNEFGGGSITALPVIEVGSDDFSSYISTNLMGMTDGHLKFDSVRYKQGTRPAIEVGLSVSRVGRQTQSYAQKSLADRVKAILAEGKKLESYSRLGSEISPKTLNTIKQSQQIEILLNQPPSTDIPIIIQMILIGLTFTPFLAQKDVNFVFLNRDKISGLINEKLDLPKFIAQVKKYADEKQFIQSIMPFSKELESLVK